MAVSRENLTRSFAVGLLGVMLVASLFVLHAPASASVIDPNVTRFDAVPSFINVNKTTGIVVDIGTSYGPNMDNYRVTVTAPDSTTATAWYNFTSGAPDTLTRTYGDVGADFMTVVNQVGTYDVRLEHFDGAVFSVSGVTELKVTDQLNVVLLIRSGSNPATEMHSCPVAQEFVRGGKYIGGAYVYYASTGETVTDLNSNAVDNITGAFLGETNFLQGAPLWHSVWYIPWDAPTGAVKFYVNASDGMGNFGSAVTGVGVIPRVTIVPDTLDVSSRILNGTGQESVLFAPGDTVRFEVEAAYDDHASHNFDYIAPLNSTRGGVVTIHVGWGDYNATSGKFANVLADLTLTLNPATETWVGTYQIPAGTANLSDVQAVVSVHDGASPPNTGTAFTTSFAIRSPPAPQIVEVPVEVPGPTTGLEAPLVGALSFVLLVMGLGVGYAVSRRRKAPKEPEELGKEE